MLCLLRRCLGPALICLLPAPALADSHEVVDSFWMDGGLPPTGRWSSFAPGFSPGFVSVARHDGVSGTVMMSCGTGADLEGLGLGLNFAVPPDIDPDEGAFFVQVGDLVLPAGGEPQVVDGQFVGIGVPSVQGGYPNPYWPGQIALLRALAGEARIGALHAADGVQDNAVPVWSMTTQGADGLSALRENCGDLSPLADREPAEAPAPAPAPSGAAAWVFVPSDRPAFYDRADFMRGDTFGLTLYCDPRYDGIGYGIDTEVMQASGFEWGDTLLLVVDGEEVPMPLAATDVGYVSAEGAAYAPWIGGPEAMTALLGAGQAALVRVAAADGARTEIFDLTTDQVDGLRPVVEVCGASAVLEAPETPANDGEAQPEPSALTTAEPEPAAQPEQAAPTGPAFAETPIPPDVTLGPTAVSGPGGASWELTAGTDRWSTLTGRQTDPDTGIELGAACAETGPVFYLRLTGPAEPRDDVSLLVDDDQQFFVDGGGFDNLLFFEPAPGLIDALSLGANVDVFGSFPPARFHLRGSMRALDAALAACRDQRPSDAGTAEDQFLTDLLERVVQSCSNIGSTGGALGEGAVSFSEAGAEVDYRNIRCEGTGSAASIGAGFCGARGCLVETWMRDEEGFALTDQTMR